MSATRRFLVTTLLAIATITLSAGSLLAQGSAPNPGGGTSARPYVEEGTTPGSSGTSAGFPIGLSLRVWTLSQFVSLEVAPEATKASIARALKARRARGR